MLMLLAHESISKKQRGVGVDSFPGTNKSIGKHGGSSGLSIGDPHLKKSKGDASVSSPVLNKPIGTTGDSSGVPTGVNPPKVVIDNDVYKNVTVIKVDSANKHGILLEVVQVLTDLNLTIKKAYISADGGWFMEVFNVTNQDGNKVTDEIVLDYIRKSLGPDESSCYSPRSTIGVKQSVDFTVIELTGTDRPGLLSELCAVLTDLQCNVVNTEIWTHRAKAAAVLQVTDEETSSADEWENNVDDEDKIGRVVPDVDVSNLKGSGANMRGWTEKSLDDELEIDVKRAVPVILDVGGTDTLIPNELLNSVDVLSSNETELSLLTESILKLLNSLARLLP
ncbi:hypothetical protein F2Q68_00005991 [Brassica cretica]|uniref:ACT domain-containing protein ACR n=1 Tax=Brassica cretica TaxID=69181 RepID=A0A8S9JB84_BRACR|nr:hypothetical protein F2Q68_00005991 [Brassica cretica]